MRCFILNDCLVGLQLSEILNFMFFSCCHSCKRAYTECHFALLDIKNNVTFIHLHTSFSYLLTKSYLPTRSGPDRKLMGIGGDQKILNSWGAEQINKNLGYRTALLPLVVMDLPAPLVFSKLDLLTSD